MLQYCNIAFKGFGLLAIFRSQSNGLHSNTELDHNFKLFYASNIIKI